MEFSLQGNEYIELNKLLKLLGLVETGGEAGVRILNGEVKLNKIRVTEKRKKIRAGDAIRFAKEEIKITE
ncbi:MAG TPA: RNA-binding S4 domain-containing protein [Chitinophagales bacterium]